MKISIVVEALENNKFQITMEDDVAVTTVTTTAPQKYLLKALADMGVKGKRGRPKITTRRAIDPAILESLPV